MSDAEPARDQLPPPSSTSEEQEILRRASGGRLLLKMVIALLVLGALAGAGWFLRRYLRILRARDVATVEFPQRAVSIGNDSRGREETQGGALEERPAHSVQV